MGESARAAPPSPFPQSDTGIIPLIESLLWSFVHRPYVTLFMVFFAILSWLEQGWTRTLLWVLSSYLIALTAEWGSINHGILFGDYTYHYDALGHDLVIFGVPFFDTLSFSFLSYVSFSFAQFFMSPLSVHHGSFQRIASSSLRQSWPTILLGSFLMVVIDWVVDPIANLGEFWFLGKIYHYPNPGVHFGVTFANYCGWFVVALLTILVNRSIDRALLAREGGEPQLHPFRYKGLFAPLFWAGIVGFQLGVTWWVALSDQPGLDRERTLLQAVTGSYLVAPILVLAVIQWLKPCNRVA